MNSLSNNFDEFLQSTMREYKQNIYSGMISSNKSNFFSQSQLDTISSQTRLSSIPMEKDIPNDIKDLLSNIKIHKSKKERKKDKQKTLLHFSSSHHQNQEINQNNSSLDDDNNDILIKTDPEYKLDKEIDEYSKLQIELKQIQQEIKKNIKNKESKKDLKKLRQKRASLVDEQIKMEENILNTSSVLYSPSYKDTFDIQNVLNYKKIEEDVKTIINSKLDQDLLLPIHREIIEKTQNEKNTIFCIGASKENFGLSTICLGFLQNSSITIIISCDKYLIQSQLKIIQKAGGIAYFFKNSSKTRDLFDIDFKNDSPYFLFMHPSFINQEIVLKFINKKMNSRIARIIIDDPFMISSLSCSFKIEYTLLPAILERFHDKQLFFQTTFINDNILNDIMKIFNIKQYVIIRDFIDFPDLYHSVIQIQNGENINEEICNWIKINSLNKSKGIIFCQNKKDLFSLHNYMNTI